MILNYKVPDAGLQAMSGTDFFLSIEKKKSSTFKTVRKFFE